MELAQLQYAIYATPLLALPRIACPSQVLSPQLVCSGLHAAPLTTHLHVLHACTICMYKCMAWHQHHCFAGHGQQICKQPCSISIHAVQVSNFWVQVQACMHISITCCVSVVWRSTSAMSLMPFHRITWLIVCRQLLAQVWKMYGRCGSGWCPLRLASSRSSARRTKEVLTCSRSFQSRRYELPHAEPTLWESNQILNGPVCLTHFFCCDSEVCSMFLRHNSRQALYIPMWLHGGVGRPLVHLCPHTYY